MAKTLQLQRGLAVVGVQEGRMEQIPSWDRGILPEAAFTEAYF